MTDSCSICLDDLKNPRRTQCNHIFCYKCVYNWINEENYYGEKNNSCPLCRRNMGVLSRVNMKLKKNEKINRKITKKKEPIKRVYRTRYKVAEENIRAILNRWEDTNMAYGTVEDLWKMSIDVSKKGKVYLCHNKSMRETFNRKMVEFGKYDPKFLTLVKK